MEENKYKMKFKTVAFIPVRGGSKSIPKKNIKIINGKPLVRWVIDAAANCDEIERIFVSTDSLEIKQVVNNFKYEKVTVVDRSYESATDDAPSEIALIEFAKNIDCENIVFIQATSPLLTNTDLTTAINEYYAGNFDSMISVVRQKRFIWENGNNTAIPINYDPMKRPRRQDFDGYFVENGAFYITKRSALLRSNCRVSGRIGLYEMSPESFFEIDEPSDWVIVEQLLKRKSKIELSDKIRHIKMLITDCDGVLTDGGMYYSENGDELKKFNTRDGHGLALLKKYGIKTAIVTGEDKELVRRRAEKLNIDEIYCGIKQKVSVVRKLISDYHLTLDEVAYVGDDLNDLEVMKIVGLPIAVNDAVEPIKDAAVYITNKKGGNGAIREVCDLIIKYKFPNHVSFP